jgi:L-asparaginase
MDELLVVTTGGTIDKVYFDDKSDYQVGEPQIGRILKELGVAFRFNVIPILRKDSLHIDAADRELMRAAIAAQPARHVLVTHGTDTMVETAKVLASIAGKTIVLTGALNPAGFRGSDAEFNIGTAVGAVQSLPPGVYVANERPRVGSLARAQERRRQPLRSARLENRLRKKKEPRPKPGFSFIAMPLVDQLLVPFRVTPE